MEQEYRVPRHVTVAAQVRPDVRRVIVHSGVTSIAVGAFRDWVNLAEVVFTGKSRLQHIGTHAFMNTALERFVAPRSLRTMRAGVFMNCKRLKEVRLNEGLETLGGDKDGVFQNSGLETIYLPSTLRSMGQKTFFGCQSLKKAEVAEGYKLDVK